MSDEEVWKKRFLIFTAVRLAGLAVFMLGLAIAFTDILRPGGWKLVGGLLIIFGVIDALIAPRILKRSWERSEP
jgi:membrane protein implicated in regulation of membrane protease activity